MQTLRFTTGNNCLFQVKNENTTRREICSKLTKATPERHILEVVTVQNIEKKSITHETVQ